MDVDETGKEKAARAVDFHVRLIGKALADEGDVGALDRHVDPAAIDVCRPRIVPCDDPGGIPKDRCGCHRLLPLTRLEVRRTLSS